jgi:hypothetical protein
MKRPLYLLGRVAVRLNVFLNNHNAASPPNRRLVFLVLTTWNFGNWALHSDGTDEPACRITEVQSDATSSAPS